jgi:hypothetical protein
MESRGLFLFLTLAVSVWAFGSVLATDAASEPKDGRGGQVANQPGKKKASQDRTTRRSLRMDELEIYGDVEKPKTMFVIPRASLRYSRKAQEKDFTNEILDPITKEWIEDTQRWRVAVPPP